MKRMFNAGSIWAPFGLFSHGAVLGDGRVVHLKGQLPLNRAGELVGDSDMEEQIRQTLSNVEAVLGECGGVICDIISVTNYTTDIDAFMAATDARAAFFGDHRPVTTTVEVNRLYNKNVMVEITVIAEIPGNRFKTVGNQVGF